MRNMTLNWVLGLMASFGHVQTAHAAPWRVELLEQPGTVNYDLDSDRPRLTTTSDGSLLAYPLNTRLRDNLDEDGYSAFARFGTTGATETFSTGTLGINAEGTLLADGSLVTVGVTVERVASDGTLIWSVLNPLGVDYGSAVQIGNDGVLVAVPVNGRLQLRRLKLDNGAIADSLDVGPVSTGSCYRVPMVGDGISAVFLGYSCGSLGIVKVLQSPLRVDPNWQPTPAFAGVGDIRFDGGALYAVVYSDSRSVLQKLDPATGAALWTYPDSGSQFSVFGQFDLIDGVVLIRVQNVTFDVSIQRLEPATGALLWTYAPMLNVNSAAAAGSDLIIGGTSGSSFEIDQARGFMERINLATGVPSWQTTLTAPQGGGSTLSGVAIQGNQTVAIGAGCPLATDGRTRCDTTLWRNALASGAPIEAAPIKVRTGNAQVGVLKSPPTQPVIATLEMGSSGPQLRIRRLAGDDGAALLDIVTPVQMTFPWQMPEFARVIQTGDGNFAALVTVEYRAALNSDAVVIKIHGSSGAVLWRRSLMDYSQGPQDINVLQIESDSGGNVFFNAAYKTPPNAPMQLVTKLTATSGNIAWQVALPSPDSFLLHIGSLDMLGDDLLLYSQPQLPGGIGWHRRRGSDGSVVWSTTTLPIFPNMVGDGYIYGTSYSGNALTVGRIDPQTGATLCTGTYVSEGDLLSNGSLPLRASDGDIYVAGLRKTGTIFKAIIARFSGSTCGPVWANRLDAVTSPRAAFTPRFVDSGMLYLSGRPAAFDVATVNTLTVLTRADGSLVGSQLLYRSGWHDPSSVRASGWPFGLDSDGALILMAASREPGQPTRTIVEKRAAPSSAVVGALRIVGDMVAAPISGSAGFDFVISVFNDGAVVAPNVRTVANFGVDVRLDNVACASAGLPCQASVEGSTVRSTSDLAVGATLTLAGRASVPSASAAQISLAGSAFSPYGFSEMNLADNILPVMLPFRDYIFGNGVESTP